MNLKLELKSSGVKKIITKIITHIIYKNIGYGIKFEINNIAVTDKDGKVSIHVDTDVEMTEDEFIKILKDNLLR